MKTFSATDLLSGPVFHISETEANKLPGVFKEAAESDFITKAGLEGLSASASWIQKGPSLKISKGLVPAIWTALYERNIGEDGTVSVCYTLANGDSCIIATDGKEIWSVGGRFGLRSAGCKTGHSNRALCSAVMAWMLEYIPETKLIDPSTPEGVCNLTTDLYAYMKGLSKYGDIELIVVTDDDGYIPYKKPTVEEEEKLSAKAEEEPKVLRTSDFTKGEFSPYGEESPFAGNPLVDSGLVNGQPIIISPEILMAAKMIKAGARNLLFVGPSSAGKSMATRALSYLCDIPLWQEAQSVSSFGTTDEIISKLTPPIAKDGEVLEGGNYLVETISPMLQAASQGYMVEFAEPNIAKDAGLLTALNNYFDWHGHVVSASGQSIKNDNGIVILTMNHGYAGTVDLNPAVISRFTVVNFSIPEQDSFVERLKVATGYEDTEGLNNCYKSFKNITDLVEEYGMSSGCIDLRSYEDALRYLQGGVFSNLKEAIERVVIAKASLVPEERVRLLSALDGIDW